MSEPTTPTGKRLLAEARNGENAAIYLAALGSPDIIAIEQEAAAAAYDAAYADGQRRGWEQNKADADRLSEGDHDSIVFTEDGLGILYDEWRKVGAQQERKRLRDALDAVRTWPNEDAPEMFAMSRLRWYEQRDILAILADPEAPSDD